MMPRHTRRINNNAFFFKKVKAKANTLDFNSRALLNDLKTSFPLELTSSISTLPTDTSKVQLLGPDAELAQTYNPSRQ